MSVPAKAQAKPLRNDPQPLYAALDLGTNNCRLLIARPNPQAKHPSKSLKVIDSYSRIVRLGEGLSESGELSADAMDRTLRALRSCKTKLDRHPVHRGRFVATEACRRARNARSFLQKVKREVGLEIDIISNEEEARLAFLGCSSLLERGTRYALAFDIGGGSTEFMWVEIDPDTELPMAKRYKVQDWLSIPYGVMNMSETFGGAAFTELYFDEIVERLMLALNPMENVNRIRHTLRQHKVQMLSTSGTVTTLAAVYLDLARYDRSKVDGLRLTIDDVRAATRKLLQMTAAERAAHPCIGSDRTDFILSGCAMFEAIVRVWPISHITIADRGVREGIIVSLMREEEQADAE